MQDYVVFYDRLISPLGNRQRLAKRLSVGNRLLTGLMYLAYPILLTYLAMVGQWSHLIASLGVPGLGFVLVSVWRRWCNQPRPYETWAISPLLQRNGSGCSMPSRHTFSATIIAMAVLLQNAWLGAVLLVVAASLGFMRVLGGLHYVRDVVVGFVLGLVLGLLLFVLT